MSGLLCSADPTHVIGLYPDLLPSDYRKQLHYPNPLPALSGAELEKAHLALIDYLTQVCAWRPHRNDSVMPFLFAVFLISLSSRNAATL